MTKVYAYVDETGDRGAPGSSSPIFGMAAVLVSEGDAPGLRTAVHGLREDFKAPEGAVLSWKSHAKTHARRKRAAQVLRDVPGLTVCYVYARKAALRAGTYRDDKVRFYNYVAFKMYKSVVWAATHQLNASELHLRFGHVRHHDHSATAAYILRASERERFLNDRIVKSIKWVSADRYAESQAADLFGGFLKAATWPSGEFNDVEPAYLLSVWNRIRNSDSCAIPLGILSMPTHQVLKSEPWFPCAGCRR